jgi:hypothetical protein
MSLLLALALIAPAAAQIASVDLPLTTFADRTVYYELYCYNGTDRLTVARPATASILSTS